MSNLDNLTATVGSMTEEQFQWFIERLRHEWPMICAKACINEADIERGGVKHIINTELPSDQKI